MNQPLAAALAATVTLSLLLPTPAAANDEAFARARAAAVEQHDANGDGRLDAAEREQMRLARKEQRLKAGSGSGVPADFLADYDENRNGEMEPSDWAKARQAETKILMEKYDANADGTLDDAEMAAMLHEVRTVRMRYARDYFAYLLKYDLNQNGEFDGDEYGRAQTAETEVLKRTYDADHDGILDPDEKARIQADMKAGIIVGFYTRFVSEALRGNRQGGSDFNDTAKKLLQFDANGDGLASADELRAIRETGKP
jgi:hypothetical protein